MNRRVARRSKTGRENAYQSVDEIAMIESFLLAVSRKDLARCWRGKYLASAIAIANRRFSAGNSIRVLKRYAAEASVGEMER